MRDLIDLPDNEEPAAGGSDTPTLFEYDEKPFRSQETLERCRHSPHLQANHLLTELPDKRLAARLTRVSPKTRAESLNEQGVTTLYVAFGFLRWFESPDSQEEVRSPLLLVPVSLNRASVESPWYLKFEDEEILPNHTIAQRMAVDFKLRFPSVGRRGNRS